VWTGRGLVTYYLLFVITLVDRVVEVVGVTGNPDEVWMRQLGRNRIDFSSFGYPHLHGRSLRFACPLHRAHVRAYRVPRK